MRALFGTGCALVALAFGALACAPARPTRGAPPALGTAAARPEAARAPNAAEPAAKGQAPSGAAADAGEPAEDDPARRASDFPASTRSLIVRDHAHVLEAPADRANYIGKVTYGTRVLWKRVQPAEEADAPAKGRGKRKPCPVWVEIEPRGWLCKDLLLPSPEPPRAIHQPVVRNGRLTPDDYYKVLADETNVFKTADDVRANVALKQLSTKVMVIGEGLVDVDGTQYQKTDHGLIEGGALARFWPSDFEGRRIEGRVPVTWPFAWVFFERGARKPPVYAAPDPESERVRAATRREIVQLLEEENGFVRIGDGAWIERKHLRVANLSSPPSGVGEADQWIDVDLDEQVLVAYRGRAPVFATLVSTGGKRHPTPSGTYRTRAKAATTPMAGDPSVPNRYEVSGVPWAIRFAKGLFVHGVYWHDGFGGARSHGCVNVSPKDAAFLYEWIEPAVPEGWAEIEVPAGEGVIIRVKDHANPNPAPAGDGADLGLGP